MEKVKKLLRSGRMESLLSSALALALALLLVGLVVALVGENPFAAFKALWNGAFGSTYYLQLTMRYAVPILLVALSFAICERNGFFNIGQEAQMHGAALMAVLVQRYLPMPGTGLSLVVTMVVGMVAAVALSVIPALLKYYFQVPEAILFVMLGFILELLNQYLYLYTDLAFPNSATMPRSIGLDAQIPTAAMYVVTLVVFTLFAVLLGKSVIGYRIKTVGLNPAFTRACGVSSVKTLMVSAAIGGGLAGLAGLLEVLSVYHFMYYNFANGFAFLGISAALLGKFSPVGMLLASVLFGALNSGSITLAATTGISDSIVQVIQGFITLLATASAIAFVRRVMGRRKSGRN